MNTNNCIGLKETFFIQEELVTIFDQRKGPYLNIDFDNNRLVPIKKRRLFYLGENERTDKFLIEEYLLKYTEDNGGDMVCYQNLYEGAIEKFYLLLPDIGEEENYMIIKVIDDEVIFIEAKF